MYGEIHSKFLLQQKKCLNDRICDTKQVKSKGSNSINETEKLKSLPLQKKCKGSILKWFSQILGVINVYLNKE